MSHFDLPLLLDAIRSGDLQRVHRTVEQYRATGICPPRLSLLEARDSNKQLPEELAFSLGRDSTSSNLDAFNQIGEYLRGQRLHMAYFE